MPDVFNFYLSCRSQYRNPLKPIKLLLLWYKMDVQRSHTLDSITDISNRELPDLPPEAYGSKISRIWSTFKKKLTLHRSTSAPGGMRRSHSVHGDRGWYFLYIIKYTICSPSLVRVAQQTHFAFHKNVSHNGRNKQ